MFSEKKNELVVARAKGRGGFVLPETVEGKGAAYERISMIGMGCILLLISVFILVLGSVLIGLLAPLPVRADVGVQPVLPGGSSIQPEGETPIQMAAEVVVINVRSATEADNALVTLAPKYYGFQWDPVWFPGIAEVEADFTMKNPTSETVSMTAWFPLASALENVDWNFNLGEIVPRIESFLVSVDGNPLDYAVSELPNPQGAEKLPLPWASFPVTFPGEVETIIHVSYKLPLQPSIKGSEMALYYIFQTGAGWAGPIGQAELVLNLPYPASEETLAGMHKLYLPPMSVGQVSTGVPSGAVLNGNQARWTWKDFEPDPDDDFAVWLLQPGKWQELATARAAVQANPEDGQAWLDLASAYHSLSLTGNNAPLLFNPFYLQPGLEAYQKAVDLLPEYPAAHTGLALLTLAPYMASKNAPPEVIQFVQDELKIAIELEVKNPDRAIEAGITSRRLEDVLSVYFYNDATATVDAATRAVFNATATVRATLDYATTTAVAKAKATYIVCWATAGGQCLTTSPTATLSPRPTLPATPIPSTTPQPSPATPTKELTLTATPVPSTTPQPVPTTTPTNAESTGSGQSPVIIVAAGVLGLVVVGYLASKRWRKSEGK
jgi:cell division septation protein DedD